MRNNISAWSFLTGRVVVEGRTTPEGIRVWMSRMATQPHVKLSRMYIFDTSEIVSRTLMQKCKLRTLSSAPPTARYSPFGCQTAMRTPKPGSGSGVNVPSRVPVRDSMCTLNLSRKLACNILCKEAMDAYLERTLPDCQMVPRRR